jgi:disulfide bond formation protein DsbB
MEGYVATITYLLAVGTVLLGLLILITLLTRLSTGAWFPPSVDGWVKKLSLHIIAGWTVLSVVLAFWYSEVVGFEPCPLCWLARTMMFPLAVIGVVAAWRNDRNAWPYLISLSAVGMLITGYHHLYQMNWISGAVCNALEGGGDCAKRYVFEFDFVTLPLMGFVLFMATALLAWIGRAK